MIWLTFGLGCVLGSLVTSFAIKVLKAGAKEEIKSLDYCRYCHYASLQHPGIADYTS